MKRIAALLLALLAAAPASAQVSWDLSDPESIAIVTDLACRISGSDLLINWTMPPAPPSWEFREAWVAVLPDDELTPSNWTSAHFIFLIEGSSLAAPGQGATYTFEDAGAALLDTGTYHVAIRFGVLFVPRGVVIDNCGVSTPNAVLPGDAADPGVVADFRAQPWDEDLLLDWTATGDDGAVGTASSLEIRIATGAPGPDVAAWWMTASPLGNTPAPLPAGSSQHLRVGRLQPETRYYLAVMTRDDRNHATLSNVAVATTAPASTGGGAHTRSGCAASSTLRGGWVALSCIFLAMRRRRTR